MKKLFCALILTLPVLAHAGQAEIQQDCMSHARAFHIIANTAAGFYPNREMSEQQLLPYAPETNPPEAGKRFAQSVIDRVYKDKSFRRLFRDTGDVDFIMPYYRNCLEEPENYLSDYNSVK
ncbi:MULTISPECIES: hypothetical protein [Serratia]|jgi:hypothetical protein|uniref:hypothetical protein n=1 Tax=Serratia TaxID=613 RepID=UPI0021B77AB6|nr:MULTISPECIES: hypothetical protein [Serratia]